MVILIVVAMGLFRFRTTHDGTTVSNADVSVEAVTPDKVVPAPEPGVPSVASPLEQAKERVTKKPFGIYIDKATSPVQPERFSGYHTGTDFETFPEEALTEVVIRAICSGEVVVKRAVSGYGGVFVTDCTIDGQVVTVIYGHLRLSSIVAKVGNHVMVGERIGLLGAGGTSETDGERKHLHLGIHLGPTIDILGYVSAKADLSGWLDPCRYVCY